MERRSLSLGARMRFPRIDVGEELRGVRIRLPQPPSYSPSTDIERGGGEGGCISGAG